MIRCALPAAIAATLVCAGAARAQERPIDADKIILVGDSTTSVGSGWGGAFCGRHVLSSLACVNLGRQGRSTSTYRAEGSWDLALNEMATPGYGAVWVLIQFGHNDQPGKRNSTELATEFPANLRAYVAEARARGARPVLVTPLTRRSFSNGRLQDTLEPWAEAVRRVARETGAPLIDLHAASGDLVQSMGALEAARMAPGAPPPDFLPELQAGNSPAAPPPAVATTAGSHGRHAEDFDYTHLGPEGAQLIAALVARDLIAAAPELAPRLAP